jgi:hypothetical protein
VARQAASRIGSIAAAGLLTLFLAACMLMPGKFASELDVSRTGNFSFLYNGEIVFLPLSRMSREKEEFEAEPCTTDSGETRQCSAAEIAEQRAEWKREQADKEKMQVATLKAFLGGLDPKDPRAAAEFAENLRRQAGWNRVEHKGDGVFDVEFALSGTLDHDFVFPTIEGVAMANAFVQISRRSDGTVRIDAPGFGPSSNPLAMGGLMQSALAKGDGDGMDMPVTEGSFTIRTNAEILANNTDEGPQPDPVGQRMEWQVTPRLPAPPTALLRLGE